MFGKFRQLVADKVLDPEGEKRLEHYVKAESDFLWELENSNDIGQEVINNFDDLKKLYNRMSQTQKDERKDKFERLLKNFYEKAPIELFNKKKLFLNLFSNNHSEFLNFLKNAQDDNTLTPDIITKVVDYLTHKINSSVNIKEVNEIKGNIQTALASSYLSGEITNNILAIASLKERKLILTELSNRVGVIAALDDGAESDHQLLQLIEDLKGFDLVNFGPNNIETYQKTVEETFFVLENKLLSLNKSTSNFITQDQSLDGITEIQENIEFMKNCISKFHEFSSENELLAIRLDKLKASMDCYNQLAIRLKFQSNTFTNPQDFILSLHNYATTIESYLDLSHREASLADEELNIDDNLFKLISEALKGEVKKYHDKFSQTLQYSLLDKGYAETVLEFNNLEKLLNNILPKINGSSLNGQNLSSVIYDVIGDENKELLQNFDTDMKFLVQTGLASVVLNEMPSLGSLSQLINSENYHEGLLKFLNDPINLEKRFKEKYKDLLDAKNDILLLINDLTVALSKANEALGQINDINSDSANDILREIKKIKSDLETADKYLEYKKNNILGQINDIKSDPSKAEDFYYLTSVLIKIDANRKSVAVYQNLSSDQQGTFLVMAMIKDSSNIPNQEKIEFASKIELANAFHRARQSIKTNSLTDSNLNILFDSFKKTLDLESDETPSGLIRRCFDELTAYELLRLRQVDQIDDKTFLKMVKENNLNLLESINQDSEPYKDAYSNRKINHDQFKKELMLDLKLLYRIQLLPKDNELNDFNEKFNELKDHFRESALKLPLCANRSVDTNLLEYISKLYGEETLVEKFEKEISSNVSLRISDLIEDHEVKYLPSNLIKILQDQWAKVLKDNLRLEDIESIQQSAQVLWPSLNNLTNDLDVLRSPDFSKDDYKSLMNKIGILKVESDDPSPIIEIYHELVTKKLIELTKREDNLIEKIKRACENISLAGVDLSSIEGLDKEYLQKQLKGTIDGLISKILSEDQITAIDKKNAILIFNKLDDIGFTVSLIDSAFALAIKNYVIDIIDHHQTLKDDFFISLVNRSGAEFFHYKNDENDLTLQEKAQEKITSYLTGAPGANESIVKDILIHLYNIKDSHAEEEQILDQIHIEHQDENKKLLNNAISEWFRREDNFHKKELISISFLDYKSPTTVGINQNSSFDYPTDWLDNIVNKKVLLPSLRKLDQLTEFAASENDKHKQRFFELRLFIEKLEVKFDAQLKNQFQDPTTQKIDFSLIHKMRDYERYLQKHAEEIKKTNPSSEKAKLLEDMSKLLNDKRQDFKRVIRSTSEDLAKKYNSSKFSNLLAHGRKGYHL